MLLEADVQYIPIDPDCCVKVLAQVPTPFEYDQDAVDGAWLVGKEQLGDSLFNGLIAHLISWTSSQIEVAFIEYKVLYAWWKGVPVTPHIRPLGVSGYTYFGDSVLMGKRSKNVSHHAGLWECIPSGSIDRESIFDGKIDVQSLLLRELYEESGVEAKHVAAMYLCGLFCDRVEGCWDLVCDIELKNEVLLSAETGEYSKLLFCKKNSSLPTPHLEEYVGLTRYLLTSHHLFRKVP